MLTATAGTWDPKGSSSLSSILAVSQLYNQIVQYDTANAGLIVCDLCESWDLSTGGTTFTFHLRDYVQWSDGNRLTSADVHSSMLRYGDLESRMGHSGLWRQYTLEARNGGVNPIDGNTVEFNLKFPSGAFLKFLGLDYVKVLPKHLLDHGIDLNLAENVIAYRSGSGPFVLEEYRRGSFYKVSKNPNYFKTGRPYFDAIDHTIIVDPGVLIAHAETDAQAIPPNSYEEPLQISALVAGLCNNAQRHPEFGYVGDPTETALLELADRSGVHLELYDRTGEVPFTSERRMMSVAVQEREGAGNLLLTKGAPEAVLPLCTHVRTPEGVSPLTDEERDALLEKNRVLAGQALRVLACAYREQTPGAPMSEEGLTIATLVAMTDPPRPEAARAIEAAHGAGIRVVMITGDNSRTAAAIGAEVGLRGETIEARELGFRPPPVPPDPPNPSPLPFAPFA